MSQPVRVQRIETIHRQLATQPHTARFRYRELVMYDLELSKGAKVVYSVLDEQCRDVGSKEVPLSALCNLTGIPERSMKRYLAELRGAEIVRTSKDFGGRNTYQMAWASPPVETGPIDNGAKTPNGAKGGPSMGPKVAPSSAPYLNTLIYKKTSQEEQTQTPGLREPKPPSNGPALVPYRPPSWERDESFAEFAELARQFWGSDLIEPDLANGWSFGWRKLDFMQKLEATRILRARLDAGEDPRYVKRLPKYLEHGDWQRSPRAKTTAREGIADGIIRRMEQRIADGERPI